MSKPLHHFYRKHQFAIFVSLSAFSLFGLTAYALSTTISDFILKVAGSYANVEGVMSYYDKIAVDKELDSDGKKSYYETIAEVHRGVAAIHNRIAGLADERYQDAGGELPTNTGGTNTGATNTGNVQEPIGDQHIQAQFYNVPYGAGGKGTLTRGSDYDGYYALSNKIPESGPFLCHAKYTYDKPKTKYRDINFNTENGVGNTSGKRTDKLVMKIDFPNDVTETFLRVDCSGTMGGSWKTIEYTETFTVVSPARAVISSFRVSNINPEPNESLTFTWQTTGAVGCSIMQPIDGGMRFSLPGQAANGTYTRNADTSGTSLYRLVCTNSLGEDSSASDIYVNIQTPGTGTGTSSPTCGSAKDQSFTSAPNTNLCTIGAPSPSPAAVDPANPNKWKWTCSLGSLLTTCSANKISTNQTGATNTPQCGTASNSSFSTAPTYNLCIQSTNPSVPTLSTTTNKWNWTCGSGTNSVNCSANYTTVSAVTCGTSNNGSFSTAPTTNLCIQSTPNPAVPSLNSTTNKWVWNCNNGSQNITCSANKPITNTQTGSTGPKCGAVNNGIYINAPTTYLCETGTAQPTVPTLDTASNKWKWSCTASGQTVDCNARKGDIASQIGQYAFSPQCADEENFISLGGMAATLGNQSVNTNYSPTTICKIPSNTPSNIFNFLSELVDPIDTIGTDGYFDWKCKGIASNGTISNEGAVTCRAKRVIDAQCGPYTNVPRATFDELTPGIRGGEVPEALKRSYCTVGNPMHEVDERRLDTENFGLFHWRCVSPDFYAKTCSAPYLQSRTINFSASTVTPTAGQNVTFNWSLPTNTAFVKCYPVYDYRAQGNNVYDFFMGPRGLQGNFSAPIDKTTVVSLYCIGKTNEVFAQKDLVITVGTTTPAPVACLGDSVNGVKSPDNQNTCNFAWGRTDAGKNVSSVTTTGGGILTGKCGNDGTWAEWSMSCPNKSATVSCPAGGATFYSNDQSNRCDAALVQKNAGQSVSLGNGLTITTTGPAATGSASCKADGNWTYMVNCPSTNAAIKTCPGGTQQLYSPSGNKTCVASWGITNANSSVSAQVTNGGTLSARCDANGNWDEASVRWSCND